jgi:hypothetical protein
MLGRVGCMLGRHAGEWTRTVDNSCAVARACPHCGKSWSDTWHSFTDWTYTAREGATSCLMERHCSRCGLTRQQPGHESRRRYLSADKCEMQPYCTRCGEVTGKVSVSHKDFQWRYLADVDPPSGSATAPLLGGFGRPEDACRGRSFCTRCGKADGPHKVRHDWGGWNPSPQGQSASQSAQQVRHCRRCKFTDTTATAVASRRRWSIS